MCMKGDLSAMIYDVQKASVWKRMSAFLFDVILLSIIAVGVAFLLSLVLNYDDHTVERMQMRADYEAQYGISFDISEEEYNVMTEAEKQNFDDAYRAFSTDPAVNQKDLLLINLSLIITAFGILAAYLVLEFFIPLKLGNGQTLGKKIFGIGVMRIDGVKLSTLQLFVRTILGKYTVETMIPVLLILIFMFNIMPLVSLVGMALLAVTQIIMLAINRYRTPIHDMIAATVTIDLASQLIFETPEELMEYKKKLHAEAAEKAEYR